jgi:hypothetical protein
MRKWLAVLLCVLAAHPVTALAQPETIESRDTSLSGLWRISLPAGFASNGVTVQFQPMRDVFCRLSDTEIHCLNGGYARDGTITRDSRNVHIAWGTMMARMAIDGAYADGTIDGKFAFKLAGIVHEAPERSRSTRLPPLRPEQDGGGKAALLRQVLTAPGAVPRDDAAIARNEGALPKELGRLGGIEAVAWLGLSPRLGHPNQTDFFSTYAVEFAGGELVCGLHQRADGVLDAFVCV